MNLEDRFYTSTEVAEILGVSLRSVYRYLEEAKLDAEVKTATGRHRFTKQNILDFLYPQGGQQVKDTEEVSVPVKEVTKKVSTQSKAKVVEPEKIQPAFEDDEDILDEDSEPIDQEDGEEVDWLSKFRAAAEKYRVQAAEEQMVKEQASPRVETLNSLADEPQVEETIEVEEEVAVPQEQKRVHYYKSNVGGLKELAQYINKAARKSNIPYAFTMNAGLSLHKLIRPFSVLHIYVRDEDREFYEKALELTESDANTAQLGIYIGNNKVFEERREIHGLYVASDMQLRKDLLEAGEIDLASELDEALNL